MIHGGKQSETRTSIKTKTLFSWDWFFNYYIKCSFFKKYKFQESVSKAFLQEVIISSPEGKQHAPGLSTKTLFIHASDLFLALQSQMWFQKYYPKFVFCRQKYQQKKKHKMISGKKQTTGRSRHMTCLTSQGNLCWNGAFQAFITEDVKF